jgi:hypothetical protein
MTTEDVLVRARRALDILWHSCRAHARGWGLKKDGSNSIFKGSNITLINDNEVVIIVARSDDPNGVVVHEFRRVRVSSTALGDRVRTFLSEHKIHHIE